MGNTKVKQKAWVTKWGRGVQKIWAITRQEGSNEVKGHCECTKHSSKNKEIWRMVRENTEVGVKFSVWAVKHTDRVCVSCYFHFQRLWPKHLLQKHSSGQIYSNKVRQKHTFMTAFILFDLLEQTDCHFKSICGISSTDSPVPLTNGIWQRQHRKSLPPLEL